jgi:hypothetical protein
MTKVDMRKGEAHPYIDKSGWFKQLLSRNDDVGP